MATSLNARLGPWNSSARKASGGSCFQWDHGGVVEGGVGLAAHLDQVRRLDFVASEGADHRGGDLMA
jgi:hypothetical protein